MESLLETIKIAESTLENLYYQKNQINCINKDINTIDSNVSISEQILYSMKSLIYRITYHKEDNSKEDNSKEDNSKEDNSKEDNSKEDNSTNRINNLELLKQINLEINKELEIQNKELENLNDNIDNSQNKINKVNKLLTI
jgi:hypothetical protein